MPYDDDLVHRLRELLGDAGPTTEKRMFGGLAFLLGGHMTVAASRTGGLLARVDPVESDDALADPHAEPMVMRGRPLDGWVLVAAEGVRTRRQLEPWVRRSVAYVRSLPPK
jgi:TfoX/Sxy family transcriptional regulator of competence genes